MLEGIHRVLVPGGLFRLSVPDYRCDVLAARCEQDSRGRIVFDPGGGGTRERPGHLRFPRYETVRVLVAGSAFGRRGRVAFLHYHDPGGRPVLRPIDYGLGYVERTPDHDARVSSPRRPLSIVVDLTKAS